MLFLLSPPLGVDALALRVRDRCLIRTAVQQAYTAEVRTANWAPPPIVIETLVQGFWDTRVGMTEREAIFGIGRAVHKLVSLLAKAPRALGLLKRALGLDENASLVQLVKSGDLVNRVRELAAMGKKALKNAFKYITGTFPLSLFFVSKHKAPGLTDLIARILSKSPKIRAALSKIKGGAHRLDQWLKKYLPNMSRILYAAVFIWVWINVAELSWDVEGILKGFTGAISLGDLLGSMPESALGLLAASFGLGYGALPYAIIARLIWLVANHFLEWVPGKGFRVRWQAMGVNERDEAVAI